ncbi:MAG: hypothetical protein QNJ33_19155 [Crocosphaera sp.]|nr:hypothetical protein [Crocosphaera sp.]
MKPLRFLACLSLFLSLFIGSAPSLADVLYFPGYLPRNTLSLPPILPLYQTAQWG